IEPKTLVLDARETAAHAENETPPRNMANKRHLLGHANRIVPGQHHHHRAQFGVPGSSRHVGEKLNRIATHGVVIEVMLYRPDGIKAERLGDFSQPYFLAPHLGVGKLVVGVLKDQSVSNMHMETLLSDARRRAGSIREPGRSSLQ